MEHRPRWGRKSRRGRPFTSDGVRIIASKPRIGRGRPFTSDGVRIIASKPRIGRIKLAVRREFIISNGRPITIRQVLQRGYPRLRRFTAWHYLAARRALRIEATVIARCRYGRGRHHEMYRHGVIRLQAADLTGIIGSATPPKPGSGRFREDTLEGVGFVFAAIRDHRRRCRP